MAKNTNLASKHSTILCARPACVVSFIYPATCGPKGHGSTGIAFSNNHILSQAGITVIVGRPYLLHPNLPFAPALCSQNSLHPPEGSLEDVVDIWLGTPVAGGVGNSGEN